MKKIDAPHPAGLTIKGLLTVTVALLGSGLFAEPAAFLSEVPPALLHDAKTPASTNVSRYGFCPYSAERDNGPGKLTRTPTGAPEFEVQLPRKTGGPIVSASDFGMRESNEDCAQAINKALEHCRKTGAAKLVLPKGTFKCFGPQGIVIDRLDNFTFDGQGAKLVFRRTSDFSKLPQYAVIEENANLLIRNCTRVKVENVKMDWDWETDPLGAFARVLNQHVAEDGGESYFDVELLNYDTYPLYPKKIPLLVIAPMAESLDGFGAHGHAMFFGPSEGHYGTKSEWLSPNRLRIYPAVKPEGVPLSDAYDYLYGAKKNRTETKYSAVVGKVYRIMHYYYGKNGINMDSNEHLTLENIDILSCRGMGMHVDGKQKFWQIQNVNVVPPSDAPRKRPCTTTADVYHFARSCGYCKLTDCEFAMNQDDIINFHDRTTFVEKISANRVKIVNKRGMYYFRAQPQDVLELFNGDATPLHVTAKVLSVDGETMELDQPVPDQKGACLFVADLAYDTANILIKDCRFKNYYGRAIIMGSNTTIDNCLFRNGPSIPLKLCMVCTLDKWAEGHGCTNVVVKNCTFDNNNLQLHTSDGFTSELYCGARIDPATGFAKPYQAAVSDILIEGNTFKNVRGLLLYAGSGENVVFRNNVLDQDPEIPGARSYSGSAFIQDFAGVSIVNNRFHIHGARDAGVIADKADTTGLLVSGNK